jgi:hypothetical protein
MLVYIGAGGILPLFCPTDLHRAARTRTTLNDQPTTPVIRETSRGQDAIRLHAPGAALAEAPGGRLVTLAGSRHLLHARDPVKINLLPREFVESLEGTAR